MKVETPQILWHSSADEEGKAAPLYSVSLLDDCAGDAPSSSAGGKRRTEAVLATAGNTPEVNLWRIRLRPRSSSAAAGGDGGDDEEASASASAAGNTAGAGRILQDFARGGADQDSKTDVKYIVSLSRHHDRSVNAVRFSPDGLRLAAAGDGGSVVVYTPQQSPSGKAPKGGFDAWSTLEKESDLSAFLTSPPTSANSVAGAADAMDLSWSPDSTRFAVACLDHSVSVFQLCTKSGGEERWNCVHRNDKDHVHYVQGVSYDPMGVYLASQGSDRTVRVWRRKRSAVKDITNPSSPEKDGNNDGGDKNELVRDALASAKFELGRAKTIKFRACAASPGKDQKKDEKDASGANNAATEGKEKAKGDDAAKQSEKDSTDSPPKSAAAAAESATDVAKKKSSAPRRHCLYADESTVESFFRRLSWTPDGAFLVTPAALCHADSEEANADGEEQASGKEPTFATYLFARHRFDAPYRVLHGLEKPSIAVRPNPVPFRLPPSASSSGSGGSPLPYRSIFAVLTLDSVLLYDTYHSRPLSVARGLHYAALNDAAWTSDGTALVVISTDGYVSVLTFEGGELGEPYVAPPKKLPQKATGVVSSPPALSSEGSSSASPAAEKANGGDGSERSSGGAGPATGSANADKECRPQEQAPVPAPAQQGKSGGPAAAVEGGAPAAPSAGPPAKEQSSALSSPPVQAQPPKKKQKKRIQPTLVACT